MSLVYAFLFGGFICLIGQIILDNTKLTPGHLNSLFVLLGAFLSFIGVYELFIKYANVGASLMITNFGNLLYEGALIGYKTNGIYGILANILAPVSCGLSVTIIMAFIMGVISKPRN